MNSKLNYLMGISLSACTLTACDRDNDVQSSYDNRAAVQQSPLVSPTPPGNPQDAGAIRAGDKAASEGSPQNPTQSSVSSSTSNMSHTELTDSTQQMDARENFEKEKLTIQQVVYFDVNSKDLDRENRAKLNDIVEDLKQNTSDAVEIRLEAYTDPSGSPEYNKRLAEQRAEAVREYLKEEGVDDASWKVLAVGEEEKRAAYNAANIENNENPDGDLYTNDAKNERRVVIYVTGL